MKKYYRSRTDRSLGGVIGGFVVYANWEVDPNLVRLAYAILTLFTGGGLLLLYILAWIIIPEEPGVIS